MTEITSENLTQGQSGATNSQPTASENNSFSIPEPYVGKGWTEKVKSVDDLWKTTANLQELIGKRPAGIPTQDAPESEWDTFYKAMGRPEKPEYDFGEFKDVPEGLDVDSFKQQAGVILHKAGLSPKQAKAVLSEYLALESKALNDSKLSAEQREKDLDTEFDKVMGEQFGDKYPEVEKAVRESMLKYTPEPLREAYAELADKPKALAAIVTAFNGMQKEIAETRKKYGAEDNLQRGDGGAQSGTNIEDIRKELSTLGLSKEFKDFTHPEHKKAAERVQVLRGVMKRYYDLQT